MSKPLKVMALPSLKMLGPNYPAVQHHIPEEQIPQPHCYEDVKHHLFVVPQHSQPSSYIMFTVCLMFSFILQVVVEQCSRS
jgi:hypothetical protein